MIHHINKTKDKNYMIITTDAEEKKKTLGKIQHLFTIKTLKVGTEGMYLNIIRDIYDKPIVNTYSIVKN